MNRLFNRSFAIFLMFLWRDFYVYFRQIKNYIINYSLIYPIIFSLSYGYIVPNTGFDPNNLPSTVIILTGVIAFMLLTLQITLNLNLLLDLENERFTEYQVTILNPKLVILQKIVFSSIFNFILVIPFFIVSKIILNNSFDTSNLSIPKLGLMLYLGSLTCASYVLIAMCKLKGTHQIGTWWRRFNSPMLLLGGSWVPWVIIYKFSSILGYIVLLNPIIYITEGIRSLFWVKPFIYHL